MACLLRSGKVVLVLVFAFMLLGAGVWWERGVQAKEGEQVTVFAAASLSDVLKKIAADYEAKAGVKIRLNLAASSTLAKQIEAGAKADVFFSADEKWADYLEKANMLKKETRKAILTNELVLVAPKGKGFAVRGEKGFDLGAAFQGRLAVGDPSHVPAGMYGEEALKHLGWWDGVKDRLAPGVDVRAALRYVELGEAGAGIVYATDATASDKVEVVFRFPPESHRPIHYVVALCKDASPLADAFLTYLKGPEAAKTFTSFGFKPLD
jgi:molybdate transport system substrate-binding protein